MKCNKKGTAMRLVVVYRLNTQKCHMGFYCLRSSIKPPHQLTSLAVGNEAKLRLDCSVPINYGPYADVLRCCFCLTDGVMICGRNQNFWRNASKVRSRCLDVWSIFKEMKKRILGLPMRIRALSSLCLLPSSGENPALPLGRVLVLLCPHAASVSDHRRAANPNF